jgi:DNA-directed RNA polymerase specialized sigma24 family protein
MPSNSISLDSRFLPEDPLHPQGAKFFEQVTGMLDGQPKDPAAVEAALTQWDGMLEKIAAELYRISSMLLGEGEEAISLIEDVVANLDLQACKDHGDARHLSRLLLAADAISVLRKRDSAANASSLAAPPDDFGPASCIEDDDLSAAGVSSDELEQMISGPEAHRLRDWLEGLSVSLRVIFVLRAVAGLSSPEVAALLAENGGPAAQNWTPDGVRSSFRQALCSLASQLIHATATK